MSFNAFLEKSGQFFFFRMRPLFFFILLSLPLFFAFFALLLKNAQLHELEHRFLKAARKEKISFQRKEKKERFLQRYSHIDPYFLEQQIEPFSFLQSEKERLLLLSKHPAFPESAQLEERLRFISQNRLAFIEENFRTTAQVKEFDEKQRHPVQMDEKDLQKILSLIEDIPIGSDTSSPTSPQMIIKEMRLTRSKTPLRTEVFDVEMELLKREFTQP